MKTLELPWKNQKLEINILLDIAKNMPSGKIRKKEISILRDLAKILMEIASGEENINTIKMWKDHNSLIETRPLVLCFPENAYKEIIPFDSLLTEDLFIREYEWYLRSIICHKQEFNDDYAIIPRLKVPARFDITSWGINEDWDSPNIPFGAAKFKQVIVDEDDIEKLTSPKIIFDKEGTVFNHSFVSEILGDIIDIEIDYSVIPMCFDLSMMGFFSRLRGLENILLDMIDRPHWVHKVMKKISDGTIKFIKDAEKQNLLGLNNADHYIGSGGLGFTDELPGDDFKGKTRLKDLWGSSESQELTGVSPEMLDEFVIPYQIKLLEYFGLNYYGCCEDLTRKFKTVKRIPNLRRISVAPWTDMETAAYELGNKYVYVWKPNPADLAAEIFDEDFIRNKIKKGLNIAKNCRVEIIMKDTHTLRGEPSRMKKWSHIAKELSEK